MAQIKDNRPEPQCDMIKHDETRCTLDGMWFCTKDGMWVCTGHVHECPCTWYRRARPKSVGEID